MLVLMLGGLHPVGKIERPKLVVSFVRGHEVGV